MDVEAFIEKYAGGKGGTERAVYQMFLTELAHLLGVPTPNMPVQGVLDAYQFEAPVKSEVVFGNKGTKRIDLYKRDHFILEAKQSQLKEGEALPAEPAADPLEPTYDLFGNVTGYNNVKGKPAPRYDRLMADARIQAERYSLGLRDGHKPPPFLIVADIGRAFELYFDWTGDGRGYGFFPDQQNYRIAFDDLRDEKIRELLRGIWTDIPSVDPRLKAAAVTRDVAARLSRVAEALEKSERQLNPGKVDTELAMGIEATSLFLMRLLFCMFAEDVGLLPERSFTAFLDESRSKSERWWQNGLHDLWAKMNQSDQLNRFWSSGDATIRHFNGNLFSSARVYDLPVEFKGELYEAARKDWRSVEPAIFGTLLEQVLTTSERAKLGAHYTPRPYVQRIVNATIGDVLTPEWHAVRDAARQCVAEDKRDEAVAMIRAFHSRLCNLRILDPACGTGNFLYVAMELLLQLEGEAIQFATELGEALAPAIHPNQFLGLELNPRAAVIAELVLWIGWLRHRLANHPQAIGDPVLPTLININQGKHGGYDAVLCRTETGEVDSALPMQPDWPEADFIIGNPPFIGKGAIMRGALGDDYCEALWKANPRVPKSADFVMQWWDRAAHILVAEGSALQRFGFVTTNSITQEFSRRVIAGYLEKSSPTGGGGGAADGEGPDEESRESGSALMRGNALGPPPPLRGSPPPAGEDFLSLILAIPDHPWTKATKDAAAVRIAMTVAARGAHQGVLIEVTGESGLDSDKPEIEVAETRATIHADLSGGADVTSAKALIANDGLSCNGMMLAGKGFRITRSDATRLIELDGPESAKVIRPFLGGSDLMQRSSDEFVIDFSGLDEKAARHTYKAAYQLLHSQVKPERDKNADKAFREKWWLFGRVRP
ncbi:MAG: hypothetical protein RLZZ366_116, partial [Pseudomonadota bacterium]